MSERDPLVTTNDNIEAGKPDTYQGGVRSARERTARALESPWVHKLVITLVRLYFPCILP